MITYDEEKYELSDNKKTFKPNKTKWNTIKNTEIDENVDTD